MSDTDSQVPLPNLDGAGGIAPDDIEAYSPEEQGSRVAADLEAVFDVPVQVSAVLGRSKMDVSVPAPCSSSTAASARRSTSTSTTAWSRAAKSSWSRTSWASP